MTAGTVYVVSPTPLRRAPTGAEAASVLPPGTSVIASDAPEAAAALRAAVVQGGDVVLLGTPGPAVEACFGAAPVVRLSAEDLTHHWATADLDLDALDALADADPPAALDRLSTLERLSALSLARWWKTERARF